MLDVVWNNISTTELRSAWMHKCHEDHGWLKVTAPLAKRLRIVL